MVDDEDSVVNVFTMVLERMGIDVAFTARDGASAVRRFAEQDPRPSIVLMDYRMHGMNGVDAMREMMKMDGTTKFIFISADDQSSSEALAAGAAEFITKPVSIKQLTETVTKICNGQN